jgi:uncharacterized protein YggE
MHPHRPLLALALCLTVLGCSKPGASGEAPPQSGRSITLNGEGFVNAKPDLAIVSVGVVTQGPTAAEALAENSKRMNSLFQLIQSMNIDAKDVQTSNLRVQPRYAPADPAQPNGNTVIAGYDANNDVTVRLRDIAKLGDALDRFVSVAGANNLQGITFDFLDPGPLMDQARKNAVADAKRKASLYAEAAGVTLGPLQSLSENGGFYPKQSYAMAAVRAAPVPVSAGESQLTANVSVTYAIQ